MMSAESSGKGMTETLRGVYSLTDTIGNGKTMLTFRSPETLEGHWPAKQYLTG